MKAGWGPHMRSFDGPVEELAGVGHEVLVQGPIKGDVDGHRLLFPAARPASLLPERGNRPCSSARQQLRPQAGLPTDTDSRSPQPQTVRTELLLYCW